jgi:thiosulfate dehydrogenase [quinone] large subunit
MASHAKRTRGSAQARSTRPNPETRPFAVAGARAGARTPRPGPDTFPGAVADSWRAQPLSALVLRAFLGLTFTFAGVQKLADPGFLHRGSPTFIGRQLDGFARGSPIGGVLRALSHAPVAVGVAIALAESAIGLGVLLGVAPVTAALCGALISTALFLSATWHVHPYFLGSDSLYAVAWVAYATMLLEARRKSSGAAPRVAPQAGRYDPGRRDVLRGAMVGTATLFLGGVAAAASRLRDTPSDGLAGSAAAPLHSTRSHPTARPSPRTARSPGMTGVPGPSPKGHEIIGLDRIPIGEAVGFSGPGGEPAVLVRLAPHNVVAFSRICTHAGCEVGYDAGARLLVCPCHGAEFDPSRKARPVAGPAPSPLQGIRVVIDPATQAVMLPPQ